MERYEWVKVSELDLLPEGAVFAGRTDREGALYVGRNEGGESGRLTVQHGRVVCIWCHHGRTSKEGDCLVVTPGSVAKWKPIQKGDRLPKGCVHAGWNKNDLDVYVARNQQGECGKLNLKDGKAFNLWCRDSSTKGDVLVIEDGSSLGLFDAVLPWCSGSSRPVTGLEASSQKRRYDTWIEKKRLQKGSLIHSLAGHNDLEGLRTHLLDSQESVDVEGRTTSRETALHHAACMGSLECAALLLAGGWDPRSPASDGSTPLHYACFKHLSDFPDGSDNTNMVHHNRCAMILLLMLYGASPEVKGLKDQRAAMAIVESWDRVAVNLEPAHCQESREVALLRRWRTFCKAIGAVARAHPEGVPLGPCCALLRLVLESTLSMILDTEDGLPPNEPSQFRGVYHPNGFEGNRPTYRHESGEYKAVHCADHWEVLDTATNEAVLVGAVEEPSAEERSDEVSFLCSRFPGFVVSGSTAPLRTFSSTSCLPFVAPHDPDSDDVPFVATLNPKSGNKMGAVFLEDASRFPIYRSRYFNIIHIATKKPVLAAFRRQLDTIRMEAKMKHSRCRPRLICGGGDGTACFALFCVFSALHGQDEQLRWSDEELSDWFPALVQMPLGTGNDFAGILGWGRTINPVNDRTGVARWCKAAVNIHRPISPFDVWGFAPENNRMKVCSLAGVSSENKNRVVFAEASPSVPFLCLLYFSMGFDAYMVAQVENNRTESRAMNFLEYGKQGSSAYWGAQRRNFDLEGVVVQVTDREEEDSQDVTQQYFPPIDRATKSAADYKTVGFMNVNSLGGGTISASNPASFDDGLLDFFRQKDLLGNLLSRGCHFNTSRHQMATFTVPDTHLGVYCQFDGEARYAFAPACGGFSLDVRQVMQIPVVMGPELQEVVLGATNGWLEVIDQDSGKEDAAFIPAKSLEECKELCIRHDFGGFCVYEGRAHFRAEEGSVLKEKLFPKKGATFFIRDESVMSVQFRFEGTEQDQAQFKSRLRKWVKGELNTEINATADEVQELQSRSDNPEGTCLRARRIAQDFGMAPTRNDCAACGRLCFNWGCKGCKRNFCKSCLKKHVGTAPSVQWMYADAGFIPLLGPFVAERDPVRWSAEACLDDAIEDMRHRCDAKRPILVYIIRQGTPQHKKNFKNAAATASWLIRYRDKDAEKQNLAKSKAEESIVHANSAPNVAGGANVVRATQSAYTLAVQRQSSIDSFTDGLDGDGGDEPQALENLEEWVVTDHHEVVGRSRMDSVLVAATAPTTVPDPEWAKSTKSCPDLLMDTSASKKGVSISEELEKPSSDSQEIEEALDEDEYRSAEDDEEATDVTNEGYMPPSSFIFRSDGED